MKLHLGCGQRYLDGYQNIDYPMSEHSVQTKSIADKQADITGLRYKADSIEEVRLHHVYEHFVRQQALALLAVWNSWLLKDGVLRIEVPDFKRTARNILNPLKSEQAKGVALRHIFGSNEAHWAVHYEGWSEENLRRALGAMQFEITKVDKNNWRGTYNIDVYAKKSRSISKTAARQAAKRYLTDFLLDTSPSEKELLTVWLKDFDTQIRRGWAKKSH